MRRFLILGHTQATRAPLSLNDPAGASGRWDLLARCVAAALLTSHGVRADAEVRLVLLGPGGPRTVRVVGAEVRSLNPDERSTVALISKALEAVDVGGHETSVTPGIHTSRWDLEANLVNCVRDGPLVQLTEDATAELEEWAPPGGTATLVMGDHHDPTREEQAVIDRHATQRVSLGPVSLHADQCLVIAHNRWDRLARAGREGAPAREADSGSWPAQTTR